MKLSDFLTDMRDSKDKKVFVTEHDLRIYAKQCEQWERLCNKQKEVIDRLMSKIDCLEAKIAVDSLESIDCIDLFA